MLMLLLMVFLTNDSVLKTIPYYQRKLDLVVTLLPMQQYLEGRGSRTLINAFFPQFALPPYHLTTLPHAKYHRPWPEDRERYCPRTLWVSFALEEN